MPFRRRSNPGRSWQLHITVNGKRYFKTLPGSMTPSEVRDYEAKMRLELAHVPKALPRNVVMLRGRKPCKGETPENSENLVRKLVVASRRLGCSKGKSGLTADQVRLLLDRANGRCEVTGIPLVYAQAVNFRRNPYAASLDRIDSRFGYTMTNCRIVAAAVNIALNDWGDAVFHEICTAYAKRPFIAREAKES